MSPNHAMCPIYCSKKLTDFIGKAALEVSEQKIPCLLGGWNGHLFYIGRKRCLILVHAISYYALLFPEIKKADFKDLSQLFAKRYIEQLLFDEVIDIPHREELLRTSLPVYLKRTNNDRKAIGTINEYIFQLQAAASDPDWAGQSLCVSNSRLNHMLVGASRPKQGDYGRPIEDMKLLLQQALAKS